MNNKWQRIKLSDVATIEISNVDKRINQNEKIVKQCNYTDIYKNWQIDQSKSCGFLTVSCSEGEFERFRLKKGQVAITKDSETKDDIGKSAYIADDFNDTVLGYHLALITPDKDRLDGYFLNCILHTKTLQKYFENNASGSGQRASLSLKILKEIPIYMPDISIQRAIARVLSQLDEKIELNNKINAELEKLAKTIYDFWFIQFNFPNKNGNPYRLSGGEMIYNPILKYDIPKGWEVLKLNDLLSANKSIYKGYKKNLYSIDLSIMPSKTMCLNERGRAENFKTNQFIMKKYDILFGSIRPYLYKAGFAPFDGLVNGTIHCFSPKKEDDYSFVLLSMVSDRVFSHAIARSVGTKMPVIRSDDLLDFSVPYNKEIVALYNKLVFSFWEIISENIQQNFEIAALRDFLLPLLMSGQVEIIDEQKTLISDKFDDIRKHWEEQEPFKFAARKDKDKDEDFKEETYDILKALAEE